MSDQSPSMETDEPLAALAPAPADAGSPAEAPSGWPWVRIARPAVIATPSGPVAADAVAAIDYAVLAAWDALSDVLARPVSLQTAAKIDANDAAASGYGVAFTAPTSSIMALVMFEPQAVRLLANALAIDAGAAPSSPAPGPVAEAGEVERGLIEYLTLIVLDRVLKSASRCTRGPVIQSFCDAAAAGVWLQKHPARSVALQLGLSGGTGTVRLHLHGLSDAHWAALQGFLSMLGWSAAGLDTVHVSLALPAITLQPAEFASLEAGDVLLLGAPSLAAMPLACELVTDTHWSLGRATVTHDTPTYLTVSFTPGHPAPRAAAALPNAAEGAVVQPVIGWANLAVGAIQRSGEGAAIHLSKDPIAPVGLYHGPRLIAEGELITLGSELGVRLVRRAVEQGAGSMHANA